MIKEKGLTKIFWRFLFYSVYNKIFNRSIREREVKIVQIENEISMQASMYVEEYFLGHSMQPADALIAAAASRLGAELLTANDKHYKCVKDIKIKKFRI